MKILPADFIRYSCAPGSSILYGRVLSLTNDSLTVETRDNAGKFTTHIIHPSMVHEIIPWYGKFSNKTEYSPMINFQGQGYQIIKKVKNFLEEHVLSDPYDLQVACRFFLHHSLQAMTPKGPKNSFVHFHYNLVFTMNTESGKINDVCFLDEGRTTKYPLGYFEFKGKIGLLSKHGSDMLHVRKWDDIPNYSQYLSRVLASATETDNESVNHEGRQLGLRFFKNKNYDLVVVMDRNLSTIVTVYPYEGSNIQFNDRKRSA